MNDGSIKGNPKAYVLRDDIVLVFLQDHALSGQPSFVLRILNSTIYNKQFCGKKKF